MILTTHNHLGDHVILTAVIHNIHLALPDLPISVLDSPYNDVFKNNPFLSKPSGALLKVQYAGSQRTGDFGTCVQGFTSYVQRALNKEIPCHYRTPQIYYQTQRKIKDDYYIIQAGYQLCASVKNYGRMNWQRFIDQNKDNVFVQVGRHEGRDVQPRLSGVFDMVNKTESLSQLFSLYKYCKGVVGPASACCHIAAAYNKPCIVISGNRQASALTGYPSVIHCGAHVDCPVCMKFYAGQGIPQKACTQLVLCGTQVIPKCMNVDIQQAFTKVLKHVY